jgi:hypothetical protein
MPKMIRLPYLLAAGLVAAMATGAFAQAEGGGLSAEFAAPFARTTEVVLDGRIWSCSGNACTSRTSDARPSVACRKLARKLGPIIRFAAPQSELDAAGLATCNQDRK